MKQYVASDSIVRRVWGRSDTVLMVFAGAAAEFALNKEVDWLYFTGKLPGDPLGRLFTTAAFAKRIIFSTEQEACQTIENIRKIHATVETRRGETIPNRAYRDVLYLLIYYSIRAYELLERPLLQEEKEAVYEVFYRVGTGMGIKGLPATYQAWLPEREVHLAENLEYGPYSADLFGQYKKHLGPARYRILLECQKLLVPARVKELLHFGNFVWLLPLVPVYRITRKLGLDGPVKAILYPAAYKHRIRELDLASR